MAEVAAPVVVVGAVPPALGEVVAAVLPGIVVLGFVLLVAGEVGVGAVVVGVVTAFVGAQASCRS